MRNELLDVKRGVTTSTTRLSARGTDTGVACPTVLETVAILGVTRKLAVSSPQLLRCGLSARECDALLATSGAACLRILVESRGVNCKLDPGKPLRSGLSARDIETLLDPAMPCGLTETLVPRGERIASEPSNVHLEGGADAEADVSVELTPGATAAVAAAVAAAMARFN